ncbi:MAG: hypothetical protein U9Q74_12610 [Gemmatimonadota bacterium]|nr:hypothetical protein [Gemmatimonadota bacterium]
MTGTAPESRIRRLARLQARVAPAAILLPLVTYVIAWIWDPYVFGLAVVALAPIQLAWGAAGFALLRTEASRGSRRASALTSAALLACGASALVLARSINWA